LVVAQSVKAELAPPLNAAQNLLNQGQLDDAMKNLLLAAAVPSLTPYETMLVERTRAAIAQRQGNNALVVQALEAAFQTGEIPSADEVGLVEAIVSIASRLNDHPRVLRWAERYAALGGTLDAVRMVRIQSQLATGDEKGAMAALAARLDAADKAGQTQPESHLRTLLSLQQKAKNAGTQRTLERLAVAYPRPEYWMDLVVSAARDPSIPDRTLIEMYRLLRVVGGVKQLDLGEELAQLASRLGQPAEALSVIEEAYAAGQMGKGGQAAAHQTLRDQVRKQAAAEAADRAAAEASARTAPNGNGLVDLGWAMVAGLTPGAAPAQVEPGLALMEQGLAMGGLRRPVEARLHLAMAQLQAGRRDAARQALKALEADAKSDPLAVPVQLWSLYAQAPAMLPTRQ
jgi:tetratricopeptide (TPR) repeat protein